MSESQDLVHRLHRQGYSDTQIGAAINRDSSLIHQIDTGRKPGNNLAPSLRDMAEGRPVTPPSRRLSASGQQARVRIGTTLRDSRRRVIQFASRSINAIEAQLHRVAQYNGKVSLLIEYRRFQAYEDDTPSRQTVSLWGKGGYSAAIILGESYNYGGLEAFIEDQIEKAHQPEMMEGRGLIIMNVVY